jgi:hypothetical protein
MGLLGAALAPSLRADEWNKRTVLTVNEPIQVPNKVLEPGKYVMRLMDSPSNRHIVQIFDQNDQHLITTVLAIPNYRLALTGKTQFTFWETPPGQPKALRAWFYPGDNYGQEFAYPKSEAVSIAAAAHTSVPTTYAENESELTTAKVASVTPQGKEEPLPEETTPQQLAQSTPPPSTPVEQDNNADRLQAQAQTPQTLPHTASPLPLIGFAGMLSLSMFFVLRLVRG